MGRAVLSVILGYIAMTIVVIVSLTVAYLILGADKAYQPGTYDVTGLWLAIMFASGLVAAMIGGAACSMIAKRGSNAPCGFAVVIVVLGSVSAVMTQTKEDPGPRGPDTPVMEAASLAKQPLWVSTALPLVGVAGMLMGAKLTGRSASGAESAGDAG